MQLKNVSKSYGNKVIFEHLNFAPEEGKVTCILGNSGNGKTTLLNIIAGLCDYEGYADKVKVSYVFQNDRLIPTMSVRDNIAYVLSGIYPDRNAMNAAVTEILRSVELSAEADSFPPTLSGGMAQRVSLARAFCYPSDVILLDEPFHSLDAALKNRLYMLFDKLFGESKRTAVLVTHDIDEAVRLGDEIFILHDKKLIPAAKPDIPRTERNILNTAECKQKLYDMIVNL